MGAADVNGDGRPDLVVSTSKGISIYWNDPFSAPAAPSAPQPVASAWFGSRYAEKALKRFARRSQGGQVERQKTIKTDAPDMFGAQEHVRP